MSVTKIQSIEKIKPYLPSSVRNLLNKQSQSALSSITELRLRAGGISTATINAQSCILGLSGFTKDTNHAIKITNEEIDSFIFKLCKGSVYSYEPTLKEGYITRFGIRVGLCGEYSQNGDKSTFSKIHSVNIRLPHHIDGCSGELLKYVSEHGFPHGKGILIASAPGVGKTTLLRDITLKLSMGTVIENEFRIMKVSVIDERAEIYMPEVFSESTADFYTGISKAKGLELSTRVMSPQVIICDEIGTQKEGVEILHANSGGVVLIASVHADTLESIYAKPHIKTLIDEGVFGLVYILERSAEKVAGKIINLCEAPLE